MYVWFVFKRSGAGPSITARQSCSHSNKFLAVLWSSWSLQTKLTRKGSCPSHWTVSDLCLHCSLLIIYMASAFSLAVMLAWFLRYRVSFLKKLALGSFKLALSFRGWGGTVYLHNDHVPTVLVAYVSGYAQV